MPGLDMSHGSVDTTLLVPFERLERKRARRCSASLEDRFPSGHKAQGQMHDPASASPAWTNPAPVASYV